MEAVTNACRAPRQNSVVCEAPDLVEGRRGRPVTYEIAYLAPNTVCEVVSDPESETPRNRDAFDLNRAHDPRVWERRRVGRLGSHPPGAAR